MNLGDRIRWSDSKGWDVIGWVAHASYSPHCTIIEIDQSVQGQENYGSEVDNLIDPAYQYKDRGMCYLMDLPAPDNMVTIHVLSTVFDQKTIPLIDYLVSKRKGKKSVKLGEWWIKSIDKSDQM